jgi:hypothetical protein
MGAMALAVVASSATTIVLAQTPASAATPVSADSHYTVSQLASGLSSPVNGLLFRATTNDLLVSEFGANRITKIGASSGTKSSFASLAAPNELAIDSQGNVYAKSHPSGPIFRFSSSGAALSPSSFASPCTGQFGETSGLAFDATNNFYVGCADAGTIWKFAAGTITSPTLFASGLPDVEGLRFDGSGRLFTTDFPGGRVFQVKPGGTQLSDHVVWATGLNCPLNVAFDPVSHDVFATGTDRVVRMSAPGIVSTFATGFTAAACGGAYALDFDPAGNLYVDDLTAGAVWKFTAGDTTPPSCALTATITGPPKQIQVTVRDTGSGLASIVVTKAVNDTVSIPSFTAGTTSPVVVTATKVDQSKSSTLALQVKDQAGNVTNCDPTTTTVVREPRGQTLSGIDGSEHFLTIQNGTPGLKSLVARVNGTTFAANNLKPGEKRTIDISSALKTGDTNAVQLIGHGPGAADVLIWDGAGTA